MEWMKSAHGNHRPGTTASRDLAGARRMRPLVQGRRPPVSDAIRAVAPAQGLGESLWGGPGRRERSPAAVHRHRSTLGHAGAQRVAAGGRCHTRRGPTRPGPRRSLAHRGAVPQLFRLADAGNGCLPQPLAGGGAGHHFRIRDRPAAAAGAIRSRTRHHSRPPGKLPGRGLQSVVPLRKRGIDEPPPSARRQALARRLRLRRSNAHHLPGAR